MNPKVFLSHASDDKQRFVIDFAEKLRANGINAWLDKWEMYPGDSLIDKIFEEGIKNADAIIIVISNNSINRPWVKEELNASMVKKINQGSKLIPVIIDDCVVPECLTSTVWERIKDLENYQSELDRIIMSVFGSKKKPPLGPPPKYATSIIDNLPGLNETDSFLMTVSCKKAIEKNDLCITLSDIAEEITLLQLPEEAIFDSLNILNGKGYIKATRIFGGAIPNFFITVFGFDEYARVSISEYDKIIETVIFQIVNSDLKNNYIMSEKLKLPLILVNHCFAILGNKGLVKLSRMSRGIIEIFHISPELKRLLN